MRRERSDWYEVITPKLRPARENGRAFFIPKLLEDGRQKRANERIWVLRRLVLHSPDLTQGLDGYSEESSPSPLVGILLRCQKPIPRTMSPIPTGRKTPTLRLTAAARINTSPLKAKSVAAVLYESALSDDPRVI